MLSSIFLQHAKAAQDAQQAKQFDLAIQHYHEALRLNPYHSPLLNNLASLYYRLKNFNQTILYAKQAVALDPHFTAAYFNLAQAESQLDHFQSAKNYYLAALQSLDQKSDIPNPNLKLIILHHLGLIAFESHDFKQAIQYWEALQNIAPHFWSDQPETWFYYGTAYSQLNQFKQAQKAYQTLVDLEPNHITGQYELGLSYLSEYKSLKHSDFNQNPVQDLLKLAQRSFEMVLTLDPNHQTARYLQHAILNNQDFKHAPAGYIQDLFDYYANHYDQHLQKTLAYRVPELLRNLISTHCPIRSYPKILDLGCGTGLSGLYFRDLGFELIGLDLSLHMLAHARKKNIYDFLVLADLYQPPFLNIQFDLIIACDVFVYHGELSDLLKIYSAFLKPNGRLLFNLEALETETLEDHTQFQVQENQRDYQINITGRYTHSESYCQTVVKNSPDLTLEYCEKTPHFRLNQDKSVPGFLITCKKG